jgi:hypothetical protein
MNKMNVPTASAWGAATTAPAETNHLTIPPLPTPPDTNNIEIPGGVGSLNAEQAAMVRAWEAAKSYQTTIKEYEMVLRKMIVQHTGIFNSLITSGTENVALDNGYKLTAVKKESYNLDNTDDKVEKALANFTDLEAALLVNWKPTLSVTAYKALPDDKKAHFNGCLEITTGAPTLEIKEPKTKK